LLKTIFIGPLRADVAKQLNSSTPINDSSKKNTGRIKTASKTVNGIRFELGSDFTF
jgi:hypothetical protein